MIKIVRFNLSLMLGFVLTAATASAAATLGPFRAPAIPLFTTDPYMQTWMMGDNTTAVSGNVKKKRRKRKEKKKHATTSSMPFTQDLAASLASGDRASTRNFVSPLPHHSVHSCTYTHLYLYTIPLLFFLPRVCLCCACFMFTVSRLFCPVLEHLDSNHPQTRHPPPFRYFRKSRSLRDIQQIGASSTRPPFLHALPTKLGTTLQTSAPLCTPAIA